MNVSDIINMLRQDPRIREDVRGFIERMNARTVRILYHDRINMVRLLADFTPEQVGALYTVFNTTPLGPPVMAALSGDGIDFAHENTQTVLTALQRDVPEEVRPYIDRLIEYGVRYTSRAEQLGGECTQRNVEDAIASLDREPLIEDAERRHQEILASISRGDIRTSEDLAGKYK